jgi:hypothetical protein
MNDDLPEGFQVEQMGSDLPAGFQVEQMGEEGEQELTWGEVGRQALSNAPSDALGVAYGMAKMASSPITEGLKAGYALGSDPKAREGLVEHYGNYLSVPGIKKNLAERPVSSALDVATIVTPVKGLGGVRAASPASKLKTIPQLKEAGGAALNVARDSGVYFTKDFVQPLGDTLRGLAYQGGFRPGRKGTAELADIMTDVEKMSDKPWGFREIRELEQDLNDAWLTAKKSGKDTVAGIAGRQRAAVRQFMEKVEEGNTDGLYATGDLTPDQAAGLHQEGLKLYATAKRGQRAETLRNLAENDASQFSMSGVANSIRKQARQVLREHHKGKPTGFNARDLEIMKTLRDGRLADWVLTEARRYSGAVGTLIGAQLGGPIGAGVGWAAGRGVSKAADKIAMQRLNRFIETIQGEGTERLQGLLGEAAHQHLVGTPRGKATVTRFIKSIGTTGAKAAGKSLALVLAQEVKRPDLAPRIESELSKLIEEIQGSVESQAQPDQQQ